jgi:hypothetical protein
MEVSDRMDAHQSSVPSLIPMTIRGSGFVFTTISIVSWIRCRHREQHQQGLRRAVRSRAVLEARTEQRADEGAVRRGDAR